MNAHFQKDLSSTTFGLAQLPFFSSFGAWFSKKCCIFGNSGEYWSHSSSILSKWLMVGLRIRLHATLKLHKKGRCRLAHKHVTKSFKSLAWSSRSKKVVKLSEQQRSTTQRTQFKTMTRSAKELLRAETIDLKVLVEYIKIDLFPTPNPTLTAVKGELGCRQ
jgi:hypothetical protein